MTFYSADPVMFESVSAVTATPSVEVGTIRTQGADMYVYVYNGGGAQIDKGYACTPSAVSGMTVTVSCVSGDLPAGFVKHATITTAAYGWVLVRGFIDNLENGMASTALAAGDVIQVDVNGTVAKGVTGFNVGKMMTATGSAGSAAGFIKLF